MDAMLQNANHPLHPDRVCFLIQNFGDHAFGGWSAFRHPDDAVDVDIDGNGDDWPDAGAANPQFCGVDGRWDACHPEQFQPWQHHGRIQSGAWMQRCLETLRDEIQPATGRYIEPHRFHFDSEIHLATTGNKNFPFLLRAMYLDNGGYRWNNVPVSAGGETMDDLWADACAEFGPGFGTNQLLLYPTQGSERDSNRWISNDGPQILNFSAPSTDPRFGFHERSHRDLYLWADPVFQRALDYSMELTAYSRLRAVFEPDPLTSNYDDTTIHRAALTAPWMFDLTGPASEECPSNPCQDFPRVWTRSFVRGESDKFQHGALHQEVSSGRWFVRTGTNTSADFGSPVLYLMGNGQEISDDRFKGEPSDTYWADACRVWDIFRKPLASSGLPPRKSWFPSSMHAHERVLDSAVATALELGNYDPEAYSPDLAPWTGMPDSLLLGYDIENPPEYPLDMAVLTHDDFSLQCSMLREKRLREFKTWDAEGFAPGTGGPHHQKLTTSWHQVWDPYIHSITPVYGMVTSPDLSEHRIDDTIPRVSGSALVPNTLDIVSETLTCSTCQPSTTHTVASFIVEFRGMGGGLNHGLRMRLENRVRNPMMEEGDRGFLPVGTIEFWKWATGSWVLMPISALRAMHGPGFAEDDDGVTNGKHYRYWSPEDEPSGGLWYGAERDFRWPADAVAGLVSSTGAVKVRLTLKHPGQFTAKWDLVQLAWTNDSGGSVSEEEEPGEAAFAMQGANVNHDDAIDENDIATFAEAYISGANAADFNQDGEVSGVDVTDFLHAFTQGGSL